METITTVLEVFTVAILLFLNPCLCSYGFIGGSGCGGSTPITEIDSVSDMSEMEPCTLVKNAKSLYTLLKLNTFGEML